MKRRNFLSGLVAGAATGNLSTVRTTAAENPRALVRLATVGGVQPPATLADVAWLEGAWIGEMPDGPVENVFLAPRFGHMPTFIRAWNKTGITFYEIAMFAEVNGSIAIRLKHFMSDLVGFEARESYIEYPLVAKEGDKLFFHRATYVRTGADSYTCYFLYMEGEREMATIVIPFRRRR
jgi:hypothetical protein